MSWELKCVEKTFQTVVIEVEVILNSRPLLHCSDDPNDLEPITPAHLLNLKPSAMLPPGIFIKEAFFGINISPICFGSDFGVSTASS